MEKKKMPPLPLLLTSDKLHLVLLALSLFERSPPLTVGSSLSEQRLTACNVDLELCRCYGSVLGPLCLKNGGGRCIYLTLINGTACRALSCLWTVVDCRIIGNPNFVLCFAFIEFTGEEGARAALSLGWDHARMLSS
ncbi:hypothetical protein Q3G72_027398 [Acer saccharum]|nr:hypothetical protein Q3G72_027398 [Acer saccharum]